MTELTSYTTSGSGASAVTSIDNRRVNTYNDNSWMTMQESFNAANTLTQRVSYTGFDNEGNVNTYSVAAYTGTNYTNTYNTTYAKYDDYKQTNIAGTSTYFQPGNTTSTYDAHWANEGRLTQVVDTATSRTRTFVNDQDGSILTKTDSGSSGTSGGTTITEQYYANNKNVGTVTANPSAASSATADFDYNFTPISDAYPSVTPGNYVVNSGDT